MFLTSPSRYFPRATGAERETREVNTQPQAMGGMRGWRAAKGSLPLTEGAPSMGDGTTAALLTPGWGFSFTRSQSTIFILGWQKRVVWLSEGKTLLCSSH